MATLERVVSPIIAGIHAGYKGKHVCRGVLTNMALEIGALPEVRRLVCQFADRKKYPERPMLSLHEDHPSVYLLGWREGDFTDIHDHGRCEVGIYVVQGIVTEDIYAATPARGKSKRCLLSFSRQLPQGTLATCPQNYIHRVGNIFPEVAATLHVYGPALDDMNIYEAVGGFLKFKEHWHQEKGAQH